MFKRIDTVFLPVQDTNGAINWFEEKMWVYLTMA